MYKTTLSSGSRGAAEPDATHEKSILQRLTCRPKPINARVIDSSERSTCNFQINRKPERFSYTYRNIDIDYRIFSNSLLSGRALRTNMYRAVQQASDPRLYFC